MSSNRNKTIEQVVTQFVSALKLAGAVDGVLAKNSETKPLYFRGIVPKRGTSKELYVTFLVTDNLAHRSADDEVLVHDVYINFTIYSRKPVPTIQDFVNKVDDELHAKDFFLDYGAEIFDTPDDTETVLYGKRITANKLVLEETV